jgi:hypothetical protein
MRRDLEAWIVTAKGADMPTFIEYAGLVDALLVAGIGVLLAQTLVCLTYLVSLDA